MTRKIPPKLFWPGLVGIISLIWLSVLLLAWALYESSERWDATQAERRASDLLGWSLEVALTPTHTSVRVELVLRDREGNPVENAQVSIVAFPNASASDRVKTSCRHSGQGVYTTLIDHPRAGLWEVRVRAERGGEIFVDTIRVEMPSALVSQ
ncbi:MAG: FixH family protein [Planctomycetota bacterium]|jgi:nitrogen fixation protein FixH